MMQIVPNTTIQISNDKDTLQNCFLSSKAKAPKKNTNGLQN